MEREIKKMTVKILKEGDQVINVWQIDSSYFIAVKQQSGEVCVYCVTLDEEKKPRLSRNSPLTIAFGEGEIESIFTTETGDVKVITD
ncbi:MAG: hypothetical protein JGK40_32135 [Microcoleus sp. PH2017_21_RUC_O_A]|uniref:hypothetical protein n=1 Tax=Microcoleus sp. PH2017_21_RUC_O_A TaxID=2798832 RepID=UPI001E0015E0|nr:hypothetical protein [Microcoleus sp. PH2017_21_RUC_O_A]MCC3532579.1 hypothetical protein [Microcoleus sp. PH2017_21_RUC_O_A]